MVHAPLAALQNRPRHVHRNAQKPNARHRQRHRMQAGAASRPERLIPIDPASTNWYCLEIGIA
jgi:hypothetical protein